MVAHMQVYMLVIMLIILLLLLGVTPDEVANTVAFLCSPDSSVSIYNPNSPNHPINHTPFRVVSYLYIYIYIYEHVLLE